MGDEGHRPQAKDVRPSIIGFGRCAYTYDSGHSGEACMVGFSSRKANMVVYVLAGYAGLEEKLACLGKHKTGRSCLYLGSLDKIELNVVGKIVTDGVARMRKHFGNLDVPYADFACLRRGKAGFPVQGGPEILRALMYHPDEDGRYAGIGGDSFMLIVK